MLYPTVYPLCLVSQSLSLFSNSPCLLILVRLSVRESQTIIIIKTGGGGITQAKLFLAKQPYQQQKCFLDLERSRRNARRFIFYFVLFYFLAIRIESSF